MSPVSRGRRPKKGGKRKPHTSRTDAGRLPAGPSGSALATLARPLRGGRPDWFDAATERVLTGAAALAAAHDARELDQQVAELIGAQLHAAVQTGRSVRFGWWFSELVDAAIERAEHGDTPGWQASVWLVHGLAAHGADLPADLLRRARNAVHDQSSGLPKWLADLPRIRATGQVRRLRDTYGTRFGVIAEYVFPGDAPAGWYLWDIDASGFVALVDAGVYDDAEQAAAAWRTQAGDPDAAVATVEDPAQLRCLVELDTGEEMAIRGDEPRRVLDNWFRAHARVNALARTLRCKGHPLPARASLYRDLDITVLTGPFTDWHARTLGNTPDPEVVEALAGEWMEGALPETWFSASPGRVRFQHELIADWITDDPVTHGVIALLPEWVHWLGQRADLRADRMQPLLDAARQAPQRQAQSTRAIAAR